MNQKSSRPLGSDQKGSLAGLKQSTPPKSNLLPFEQIISTLDEDTLKIEIINEEIVTIPTTSIDNPYTPQRYVYTKEMIQQMASSLLKEGDGDALKGQLQPIIVTNSSTCLDRFEVVDGLTRLMAFKDHHLSKFIKAIVRKNLSPVERFRVGHMSNLQRNAPTDFDLGMVYADTLAKDIYPTESALAADMQISKSKLHGYLSFSKLPAEVRELISESASCFTYNEASRLLSLSNKANIDYVLNIAKRIANGSLTFSKLNKIVSNFENDDIKPSRVRRDTRNILDLGKIKFGNGRLQLDLEGISDETLKLLAQQIENLVTSAIKENNEKH
ncbi:ParB/RepB/Spo0J family partition protein [Chromobacterium amazonense]|uniref:ParB/RepB/Spo0J family partition protein n=1 Tax=Chromobacterium amazonense TaxID=1382803 RepID=UPI003F79EE25